MHEQLLLLRPRSDESFANFFVGAANTAVVHALRHWLSSDSVLFYLYGAASSGRTHLLQAVCREYGGLYLPLAELREQNPQQVLEGLEHVGTLCLDDIHVVLEDAAWCEYLFHLFNRCMQSGAKLLVSADRPSAQLACVLPDLQSRLRSGGDFRLRLLDEDERGQALRLRGRERGIDLSEEVVAYILARQSRAFPALLAVLEQLDTQSLKEKKPITIPFVRRVLDTPNSNTENY